MAIVENMQQVLQRGLRRQGAHFAGHRAAHVLAEVLRFAVHRQQQIPFVQDADHLVVGQHRQLRYIVQAHALVDHVQGLVRVARHGAAVGVTAHDQIGQIAQPRQFHQAVVHQPVIVVHLGQILVAAVAHQRHHALGRGLGAAIAQGRRQQRAGRGASQNALPAQQQAGAVEAFLVADAVGALDQAEIGLRRDEVLAYAFDQPAAGLAVTAGLDMIGQHRAHRVRQHDFQLRRLAAEETGQPGQRAAGAYAHHHRVQFVVHLRPDFRRGAGFMRQRVGRIVELVDVVSARRVLAMRAARSW